MKNESDLDYYIFNNELIKTSNSSKFDNIEKGYIYEVIRVIDSEPLFFTPHIVRMRSSIKSLGYEMKKTEEEILKAIRKLIEINKIKNQNIKIIYLNVESKEQNILIYSVKSHYPNEEAYINGIEVILVDSERSNPNIKAMDINFREYITKRLKDENAFEALLVDGKGSITEGSKSNFFYIKGKSLYTPPSEKVLLGITRNEVIDSAAEIGIELKEEVFKKEDIKTIDAAFLTGTSINALPIRKIDKVELDSSTNEIMIKILESYEDKVKKDIEKLRD